MTPRPAVGGLLALLLGAVACTSGSGGNVGGPAPTSVEQTQPSVETSTVVELDPESLQAGPVAEVVRSPLADESIYFVMTDRFSNGDTGNDRGGSAGDSPLVHGFLPSDAGYFHGGDLTGLTESLPYLVDLGIGAIWITPPFTNRVVQGDGTIEGSSAGYHGYWQIDWSRVDPHLGSDDDMQRFIEAAHDAGVLVYFDIVLNHTGDVISLRDRDGEATTPVYVSKKQYPYLDGAGSPFDDAEVAGSSGFPDLDAGVSFPYLPRFETESDAVVKWPGWLNDPTNYHNRGDSLFTGENSLYGDFYGLDDLFTERPEVVQGMIELHADILDRYEIDGVRIDTVKHVNDEFWAAFVPALREAALERGRPDFRIFGEVFSEDPILNSAYSTRWGMGGTLDFVFAGGLRDYVARNADAAVLAQVFDADDWYLDVDSNASMLVTFFGNHDMGRMGRMIVDVEGEPSATNASALLSDMRLGFDLLFLSRGTPTIYYGDEQGFVGAGRDQQARQSMFPSSTPDYIEPDAPGVATIGSAATAADDNFDPSHPLYRWVADLHRLRSDHPALATGSQTVLATKGPVIAFSRIDPVERIEYLVVANNAETPIEIEVPSLSGATDFLPIWGDVPSTRRFRSSPEGTVVVTAPGRSALVLRAEDAIVIPDEPASIELLRPTDGAVIPSERFRFEAVLDDRRPATVTFAVSIDGNRPTVIGADDAPPYRVYWNNGTTVEGSAVPTGSTVEVIATVVDGSGQRRSARTTATLTRP